MALDLWGNLVELDIVELGFLVLGSGSLEFGFSVGLLEELGERFGWLFLGVDVCPVIINEDKFWSLLYLWFCGIGFS